MIFFLVKVLDAQCLGISSKIESAFRFRLGFGYTTRLVHGCEPWPNMKSAALAANSPAACQRNFASLIREGGKTILPKHIRCMASWRNVFIDSFDSFDEKEKNMEKSCGRVDLPDRCSIWQRNFYKLMNLRQNRHDYSINLIGYRGSICCIPQCQT